MPAKHSRHIALTGPHAEWIDGQVANGEYASASDVIRTAIRLLRAQGESQGAGSSATTSQPAQQHGRV
ncbi:type II toxin-antitoxin system ParD family antitoxin [Methylobacterium sp. GC_Met_2]|uniref:ribbon-helix-helix domain-containing protein n=1 Tax=Methylobacterium sp. GC_Met_2 TaxID=2937376 RepID=UPI00226B3C8D|nr:type II toxin-antitoxin system ParD family antitoxin [Methylobacterium sp. GC_Met_2]